MKRDETLIDEAWLKSVGFRELGNDNILRLYLNNLTLEWNSGFGSVTISGFTKHYKTRRDLRQLFEALGLDQLLEKAKS